MGRLGAIGFWQRFNADAAFRERMHNTWTNQRYNRNQKKLAARKGATAFWLRYRSDPEFRKAIDLKLKESRSKGGPRSLLSIGEQRFKNRPAASASTRAWPTYHDSEGNVLRSRLAARVAQALQDGGLPYIVERRLVVPGRAFFPYFTLDDGKKLIEVVGYAADWY